MRDGDEGREGCPVRDGMEEGKVRGKMQRMKRFIILLGFFLLAFAIFGKSLGNDFVDFDDGLLIFENPIIQEISVWSLKQAFTTYDPELYVPLTMISYQIDHLLWGMNPFGFHLTNLVLHTMNALLVTVFIQLLMRRSPYHLLPVLCGLLFLVHPLHTEAVAWASARKDVLSSFFFLLSVCSYLQWREREKKEERSGKLLYSFSIFAFALGLLAKVSIIMLPVILLLIEWLQGRSLREKTLWIEKIPYIFLSVLFGIAALGGKQGNSGLLFEKILIGCKATVFYITKLFWPTGLSVLYPYTENISITNADLFISFTIVVVTVIVCLFFVISPSPYPSLKGGEALRRILPFCIFFFLVTLTPSFTNFAKGKDILRDVYFASDRYAYLPSIGIFFVIGLFSHWMMRKVHMKYAPALFAVIILPLSVLSYQQARVWKNTETLFTTVIRHYPNSHLAYSNLGTIAFNKGDFAQAADYYEKSLEIRPNSAAYFNLGNMLGKIGEIPQAMKMYHKAIEQKPTDYEAYANLGELHMRRGEFTEAIAAFGQAITIDPTFTIAHFNLGLIYERLGRIDDARQAFERVVKLNPADGEAQEKLGEP